MYVKWTSILSVAAVLAEKVSPPNAMVKLPDFDKFTSVEEQEDFAYPNSLKKQQKAAAEKIERSMKPVIKPSFNKITSMINIFMLTKMAFVSWIVLFLIHLSKYRNSPLVLGCCCLPTYMIASLGNIYQYILGSANMIVYTSIILLAAVYGSYFWLPDEHKERFFFASTALLIAQIMIHSITSMDGWEPPYTGVAAVVYTAALGDIPVYIAHLFVIYTMAFLLYLLLRGFSALLDRRDYNSVQEMEIQDMEPHEYQLLEQLKGYMVLIHVVYLTVTCVSFGFGLDYTPMMLSTLPCTPLLYGFAAMLAAIILFVILALNRNMISYLANSLRAKIDHLRDRGIDASVVHHQEEWRLKGLQRHTNDVTRYGTEYL